MNEQEIIEAFLRQHRPEFVADRDAYLKQNIDWILTRAERPLTQQSMWAAVDQLDEDEKKLILAAEYASSWGEFQMLNPDKTGTAFRRKFLKEMREKEIRASTKHAYDALIKKLGREDLRGTPVAKLRELEMKFDLVAEILNLLRSPDGTGRGGRYSDLDLKSLRLKLWQRDWTIEKLQARKDEIVEAQ